MSREESKMLNTEEIAERLGVCRRTILAMVERREIPFYRLGPRALRFDPQEVMDAVKVDRPKRGVQKYLSSEAGA